jgi:hypothetical protein
LIKPGEIVCWHKDVISVQKCHFTKTYIISDVVSMNEGLLERAMNY